MYKYINKAVCEYRVEIKVKDEAENNEEEVVIEGQEVDEDALFAELAEKRENPESTSEEDDPDLSPADDAPADEGGDAAAEAAGKEEPGEKDEDPLKDWPEDAKKLYLEQQDVLTKSQEEVGKLNHRIESDSGRVAAYQREYETAKTKLERIEAGEDSEITKDQLASAMETDENWKEFKEEHPEIATAIMTLVQKQQEISDQNTKEAMAPLVEKNAEDSMEEAYLEIDTSYPSWRQEVLTQNYADWIKDQPAVVRALGESDDVNDATSLMNLYDTHRLATGLESMKQKTDLDDKSDVKKSETDERRKQQLEDGSGVESKPAGIEVSADGLDDEERIWNAEANKRERNRPAA